MNSPVLSRWDVAYWSSRLPGSREDVIAELDPALFSNAEPARIALEAAFEARDWGLAQHIKNNWLGVIDPNDTENRSSWPKRELLYYLRGKTESKWLDMLLEAKASPVDKQDQSLLAEATSEIYKQVVDFRETQHLDRYVEVADKLLAQGADPSSGNPSTLDQVSRLLEYVRTIAPDFLNPMEILRVKMQDAKDLHFSYGKIKDDMCDALRCQNLSAVSGLMKAFSEVPLPHRTWSPLDACLKLAQGNPSYDTASSIKALLGGGLCASGHDHSGQTPLYVLCSSEDMPPAARNSLINIFLGHGADPSVANQQGFHHHPTAADTPLHACSLLDDAPVETLSKCGADLNAVDVRGMTPLLYASREVRSPVMRDLLLLGANAHCVGPDGKTAAHEFMDNCISQNSGVYNDSESLAATALLLHRSGLDFSALDGEGKSAWEGLFSSLDWNDRDEDVVSLLQSMADNEISIPWGHLLELAQACSRRSAAHAFVQKKTLDATTVPVGLTHKMRRM